MEGEDRLANVGCRRKLSIGPSWLSAKPILREPWQNGPSGPAMVAKGSLGIGASAAPFLRQFSARDSAMSRMEVISSLEWHRRWSDDQKWAIIAEAVAYSASVLEPLPRGHGKAASPFGRLATDTERG